MTIAIRTGQMFNETKYFEFVQESKSHSYMPVLCERSRERDNFTFTLTSKGIKFHRITELSDPGRSEFSNNPGEIMKMEQNGPIWLPLIRLRHKCQYGTEPIKKSMTGENRNARVQLATQRILS
jgi:hypothetical protein